MTKKKRDANKENKRAKYVAHGKRALTEGDFYESITLRLLFFSGEKQANIEARKDDKKRQSIADCQSFLNYMESVDRDELEEEVLLCIEQFDGLSLERFEYANRLMNLLAEYVELHGIDHFGGTECWFWTITWWLNKIFDISENVFFCGENGCTLVRADSRPCCNAPG
jgi:hypothetical protein